MSYAEPMIVCRDCGESEYVSATHHCTEPEKEARCPCCNDLTATVQRQHPFYEHEIKVVEVCKCGWERVIA